MSDDVTSTPDHCAPSALKTISRMRWLHVSIFLVTWLDPRTMEERTLGRFPSDSSTHTSKCDLVVGCADATDEVMLAIHLPLKLRNVSKAACDMYLVIPADALDMRNTHSASSYSILVPPPTQQLRKAGVQEDEESICCHFSLLKAPSPVVMPIPRSQRLPSEHARGLLLSLKSLSEAMSFDVYLVRSPENEDVVQKIFQKLRSGHAQSPKIYWRNTLSGREVTTNDWTAYQIHDKEALPVDWNPLVEQSPPPYKETVQAARRDDEEAFLSTKFPQHLDFESLPKPMNALLIPDTKSPSISEDGGEDESEASIVRPNETIREGRQKNYQAPEAPREDIYREHSLEQSRRPKRKADEAGSNAESVSRVCVAFSDYALRFGSKRITKTAHQFGIVLEFRNHVLTTPSLLKGTFTHISVCPGIIISGSGLFCCHLLQRLPSALGAPSFATMTHSDLSLARAVARAPKVACSPPITLS